MGRHSHVSFHLKVPANQEPGFRKFPVNFGSQPNLFIFFCSSNQKPQNKKLVCKIPEKKCHSNDTFAFFWLLSVGPFRFAEFRRWLCFLVTHLQISQDKINQVTGINFCSVLVCLFFFLKKLPLIPTNCQSIWWVNVRSQGFFCVVNIATSLYLCWLHAQQVLLVAMNISLKYFALNQ